MKVRYSYAKVKEQKLYYSSIGKGKTTIFLLGWLSNIDKFPIEELLDNHKETLKNNRFIFLHLSNYYKSSISDRGYTVSLYTKQIKDFCNKLNLKKVNLVAHSAGGRYAINFASKYSNNVNKLVLVSPAGLSNKKATIPQLNKVRGYFHKFEDLDKRQTKILKETFKNVYGTDLKSNLKNIKCPTLIIWGTNDTTTPYKRSKILVSNIQNSLLYPLKNKGHMVIKDSNAFYYIINFILEDIKVINNLIKLSKSKELNKDIQRYKYNYLRVNPTYKARKLFILFINKQKIEHIGQQYMAIESALEKLCQLFLKTNAKKYKDFANLHGVDFKKLRSCTNNTLYNYARIDSIYNGKDANLIEFNARRPQMFEDVDWFNQYFKTHDIHVNNKYNLTDKIIKSIKLQCKDNKCNPKNIILITDFNKKSPYSFYNRLKNNFGNSNIKKLTTKNAAEQINKSEYKNRCLYLDGQKIDLIIVQSLGTGKNSFFYNSGKIVNQNVREAYFNNKLQISSPLTSSVFGRKQSLELLQIKTIQNKLNLTKKELSAIDKLPKTEEFKSVKQLNKNTVVKIQGLGSGKGVYFYKDIGEKEKNMFTKIAKRKKHNILIQERINLPSVKIYSLKTCKPVLASVSLEPFIVNINGKSKIVDYTVRAVKGKHTVENTKFNPVFNKPNIWFGGLIKY